jgi:DNA polymerase-3 subunit delta
MPIINYKMLKNSLKKIENLYIFFGDNSYLIKCFENKIINILLKDKKNIFNFIKLDEEEVGFEKLFLAIDTPPIGSNKKIIIVKNLQINKENFKKIIEISQKIPEFSVLIFEFFLDISYKKNKNLNDFLFEISEKNIAVNFWESRNLQIEKQILIWTEKNGKKISLENAIFLKSLCKDDINELENDIQKICFLCKNNEILEEDILKIINKKQKKYEIFDINKAFLNKNYNEIFKINEFLIYEKKVEPIAILAIFSGIFTDFFKFKAAQKNGTKMGDAAELLELKGGEYRLKIAGQNVAMSESDCAKCIEAMLEADILMKTSKVNQMFLLEEIFVKTCKIMKRYY